MERFIKFGRELGWGWCCQPAKGRDRFFREVLYGKRLPIFWVIGPSGSGKADFGEMLAKKIGYNFVKVSTLLREELAKKKFHANMIDYFMSKGQDVPDEIVVILMKEFIIQNVEHATGFIFCGFPAHVRQAKLFELEVAKVNVVIYCALPVEGVLERLTSKYGQIDAAKIKKEYEVKYKYLQALHKYYEHKTLKLYMKIPAAQLCSELIADLNKYYKYNFKD